MISINKKIPDTNVIIRYLLKDHEEHFKIAHEFFESVKSGNTKIIINECVIAECVYVLLKIYNVPKDNIVSNLKILLSYKGVKNIDREELIEALTLFNIYNIDIVDCILCAKAKKLGMELFTFDKELMKRC
ncbi:MAG: PIN domain-containing protein [Nitrospirae bacterium]|nr:PIN domain-containing protein [Nitrospirota bacterium]MBF0541953.1 PIN domain-containing protein [Nitrospirota bacterium]